METMSLKAVSLLRLSGNSEGNPKETSGFPTPVINRSKTDIRETFSKHAIPVSKAGNYTATSGGDVTEIARSVNAVATMDDILRKAVQDIQAGGKWKATPEVREIESTVDRLYQEVSAGRKTIEDFKTVCLRWKRAGTQESEPEPDGGVWDEATAALIDWFQGADLPKRPYSISPYEKVLQPEWFYITLEQDIAVGPKGSRARYGALQSDLRRLKAYCEGRRANA